MCCARVEAVYILGGARRQHSGNLFRSRKMCVHMYNCALPYVKQESGGKHSNIAASAAHHRVRCLNFCKTTNVAFF
jgi:hypothetical protein